MDVDDAREIFFCTYCGTKHIINNEGPPAKGIDELIKDGETLLKLNKTDDAYKKFIAAIDMDPVSIRAWLGRAQTCGKEYVSENFRTAYMLAKEAADGIQMENVAAKWCEFIATYEWDKLGMGRDGGYSGAFAKYDLSKDYEETCAHLGEEIAREMVVTKLIGHIKAKVSRGVKLERISDYEYKSYYDVFHNKMVFEFLDRLEKNYVIRQMICEGNLIEEYIREQKDMYPLMARNGELKFSNGERRAETIFSVAKHLCYQDWDTIDDYNKRQLFSNYEIQQRDGVKEKAEEISHGYKYTAEELAEKRAEHYGKTEEITPKKKGFWSKLKGNNR